MDVIIAGGGIGGLTLGLALQRRGIACRIFESAPAIKAVGVGINILPHASKELGELGLEPALSKVAIATREATFFNRFGQLIYSEPLGRYAGYEWPQFSIHRGDLHSVLLDAFRSRAGADRYVTGWHCVRAEQDAGGVTVHFRGNGEVSDPQPQRGLALIACDGIHSSIRKQLYPDEGEPIYSGVNMWRGVTRWKPVLSGANMIRAGWLANGKMVIYPIRDNIDAEGRQLVNWVAEIETPEYRRWDWNRPAELENFIGAYADWHFDWLDVPAMIRAADVVLEFPMVDKDPLERWSFGRITLLGDAAHPMYPRGSNGAGQAIVDARVVADCLAGNSDTVEALRDYEAQRLVVTGNVVRTNRKDPPDAILREVYQRTGDKPFSNIDDVIGKDELMAITQGYKRVAGYDRNTLQSGR